MIHDESGKTTFQPNVRSKHHQIPSTNSSQNTFYFRDMCQPKNTVSVIIVIRIFHQHAHTLEEHTIFWIELGLIDTIKVTERIAVVIVFI